MKSNKGFTLVEMAIVLIIIGIILGAVVKGQDLITNAKSKKVIATANTWNALIYAYMDRVGRFPGDAGRDGIMGNQTAAPNNEVTLSATPGAALSELTLVNTGMSNAPQNPVMAGGSSFYLYPGFITIAGINRNAIIICPDPACARVMTADEMQVIQSMDTAIDGVSGAATGQFRAFTAAPTLSPAVPAAVAAAGNRFVATLTAGTPISTTAQGVIATTWAITHRGAIWLFDRPF